jgi:hypothetical protein
LFLALLSGAFASSTVTVSELEKSGRDQGSMLVQLQTTDDPTAFELDFLFDPTQVEVLSPVSLQIPGGASEDYSLDANIVGAGTMRVVLSSPRLKPLVSGTSMRLPVRAASGRDQIQNYLPVLVSNMELSDTQAQSLRPKLGTTVRVKGFEKGVKYDGKAGVSLALDLLKDASTSVSSVEYFANSVKIQNAPGTDAISWRPPGSGTFELTARVTLADGSVVESRAMPVIVSGLATRPVSASYTGAVMDTSAGKSAAATGLVTFATTSAGSLGSYSMRLLLNGVSLGVAGRFGAESVATAAVSAKLPAAGLKTLRLRFQQEATGIADTIRGVITDGTIDSAGETSGGSFVSDFVASRNVWTKSLKETGQMAGKYTVSLPVVDELGAVTSGIGLISLSNLGVVTGLFTLGDGIRSSLSGWISVDGMWQPYASLYSNRGFLSGAIDFSDKGRSGWIGGVADWRRSVSELRELDVVGGKFVPPVNTTVFPVRRAAGNAVVILSGGTLSAPISQSVTLSAFNSITVNLPNPYRLSLTLDRVGGSFTGSFWPSGARSSVPIAGVLLPQESKGKGLFIPSGSTGTFKSGTVSFEAR